MSTEEGGLKTSNPILEKINTILKELGCTAIWLKVPEFLPEYETLRGKKVLMVEDIKEVIENNLLEFMVATDGNASFLHHQEQSADELVVTIMENNPDIVLMDYSLAKNIKGTEVLQKLIAAGFTGKIIGFSSERDKDKLFMQAGAHGTIAKGDFDVTDTVKALATIMMGGK